MKNWMVVRSDRSEDLKAILEFLHQRFTEIFGSETMEAETCIVFNDSNAECPMFITSANPVCIRLAQDSLSQWAQTIYQLSHEMCHYAIRQHKTDREFSLKWFEEISCEATSLYFLQYAATNWNNCCLSRLMPIYDMIIKAYLDVELSKPATDSFQKCDTVEKLKNNEAVMESDREGHRAERNLIFKAISSEPEKINTLCYYMDYMKEDQITLDFDKWLTDYDCELLRTFNEIMRRKTARYF